MYNFLRTPKTIRRILRNVLRETPCWEEAPLQCQPNSQRVNTSGSGHGNGDSALDNSKVCDDRRRTLACVVPAMVLPCAASLVYYVLLAGSTLAMVIYAATKVFTVVWPVIVTFTVEGFRFARGGVQWRKHLAALPLGIASGVFIGSVIIGGYSLEPIGDYAHRFSDDVTTKVAETGIAEPSSYVVFCIFMAGLHSLIEEFFWRWYVFGRLMKVVGRGTAYLTASFAFAAHHYVVLGCYFSTVGTLIFGTCVALGGALWCWLYERQSTLVGSWISHALADAAIFYVGYQLIFMP